MTEEIDPKTGLKVRKITELKANAAEEYQDAMMHRVKELHVQDNKVKILLKPNAPFSSLVGNMLVS